MAKNIWLLGGITEEWTETVNNQVGPDTTGSHKRTIDTLSDANCRYFSKAGDDGWAGTFAAPKLTCQAAIDQAVTDGKDNFACKDSEVYEECIDLKLKNGYALDTFAPTMKIVTGTTLKSWSTTASNVRVLFVWTDGYCYAGTGNGIYRSNDGGVTWTGVGGYTGKSIVKFVSIGNTLYALNTTDQLILSSTDGSSWSTFSNVTSLFYTVGGGVATIGKYRETLLVGGRAYTAGQFSLYYRSGGSWVGVGFQTYTGSGGNCSAIEYDEDYYFTVFVQEKDLDNGGTGYFLYNFKIEYGIPTYQKIFQSKSSLQIRNYWNRVYVQDGSSIFTNYNYTGNKENFTTYTDRNRSGITWNIGNIYLTKAFELFIYDSGASKFYVTRNGGYTFSEITLPANYSLVGMAEFGPGLLFGDGNATGGYTMAALDVWGVTGNGTLNGFILDGNNRVGYNALYQGTIILSWCEVKGWKNIGKNLNITQAELHNNIIHNCGTGYWKENYELEMDRFYALNNLFYDIDEYALRYRNVSLNCRHNTFINCGYAMDNLGDTTIISCKDNMIWKSKLADIKTVENMTIDYTLFNSYSAPDGISITCAHKFISNPLFKSEEDYDSQLKSKAAGFPVDSLYIKGEAGQASDSKDLGCWDITRTLVDTDFDWNLRLKVNPRGKPKIQFKPAHFGRSQGPTGVFHFWEGGVKRYFTLEWPHAANDNWYEQANALAYLFFSADPDTVFRFGATEDGTTWAAKRSGTGTVSGSAITVTCNGQVWAKNQWTGYWIKIDGTHYRITGHPAKSASGSCALTVDGTPTTGSQAWSIDFILVKLDKEPGFTQEALFFSFDDTVPIMSDYAVNLVEVDAE